MRIASAAAVAAAISFVSLLPSGAHADFIYNLSVTNSFTGSGSISFDALSGSDADFTNTDGVSAFSFHTSTGAGSPQDYDLADLVAVDWSIDSSFNLSLLLSTAQIPFGSGVSAVLLTNQSGAHVLACGLGPFGTFGSFTCEAHLSDVAGNGDGVLSASRVTSVPEPASIALFAAGLAGLGWMSRRRKVI